MEGTLIKRLKDQDPELDDLYLGHDILTVCGLRNRNYHGQKHVSEFTRALENNTVVQTVRINRYFMTSLTHGQTERFFLALSKVRNLQYVTMSNFDLNLDSHLIGILLAKAKFLQKLELDKVKMTGGASQYATQTGVYSASLVSFSMTNNCTITNTGHEFPFDPFLQYLSRCRNLQQVVLSKCNSQCWTPLYFAKLSLLPKLTSLSLNFLDLSEPQLNLFTKRVDGRKNLKLQELDLSCNVSSENLVCTALANNSRKKIFSCLVKLNLKNCGITGDGVQVLVQAILAYQPSQRRSIVRDTANSLVACNVALEVLKLSDNNIGNIGAISLASLLANAGMQVGLKKLTLARCEIGEDGGIAIANSLTTNNTLVKLDVSSNTFSQAAIISFATALKDRQNSSLKSLKMYNVFDVYYPDFATPCYQAMYNMLDTNYTLQRLSFCEGEWDEEIIRYRRIKALLILNKLGRGRVLENDCPTELKQKMLYALLPHHRDSLFYMLQEKPSLIYHSPSFNQEVVVEIMESRT